MKPFKFFQKKQSIRWRTHNGDVWCVHDMSTQHIRNVVACLCGQGNMRIPEPYEGKHRIEWLFIFRDELRRRDETI